jgi:hypothetical protein
MFGLQRGSTAAPVAGGRINNRHCVARRCARGGFVSYCGDGGGVDGMALHVGPRSRVGWLDLLVIDEIPPFLTVVLVLVVVFVVGLLGRIVLLAARQDLNTRRVFVAVILVARVVVDCDSFPESDGDVSVALYFARR